MNNKSYLVVYGIVGLLLTAFALTQAVVSNDQAGQRQYTKGDLQKLYFSFLKDEGYHASVDRDGDVIFKCEGKAFFIAVDDGDPQFFRLILPNVWKIDSDLERQQVLLAAHHSTMKVKCAKVFIVKDHVWASIEMFVESPPAFEPVFNRSMSAIVTGLKCFVEKMQQQQSAGQSDGIKHIDGLRSFRSWSI